LTAIPVAVSLLAGTGIAVTSDDLFAVLLIAGMIVALVRPSTPLTRLLALAMLGIPVVLFRWLLAVEPPQVTPDGYLLPMSGTSMLALGEIAVVLVLGFAVAARAKTALAELPTAVPVDVTAAAKPYA
jgi:hypothetical protein